MNGQQHLSETVITVKDLRINGQGGFVLRVPDLAVQRGSLVALVGRNGSGKSTLVDALLNLIQIDTGSVQLFGQDLARIPADHPLRTRIGAQVQGMTWTWSIKVSEILAIHNSLYGTTDEGVLEALGVGQLHSLIYRKLSTGQRRRVDLAVALAHRPDIVVLDEPSSGLDRQFEVGFRQILKQQCEAGATLVLATHDELDVGMADRILWLDRGQIIDDGTPAAILEREVGRFVGTVDTTSGIDTTPIEQDLAAKARATTHVGHELRFFGDAALREPFVQAMERHSVGAYVVRPTQSSDLLDLIRGRAEHGPAL
ncbi:ATP-binding cassette domain-containing protein [Asticcacaulis sp.]|uniref:ATP-binding cassette domain-containing protein n=1 Tax=Asticcacaulis sp. TaxID=1872648 RepID=UPI002635B910|nr:ABC transporter ATP-binding protein [Asticcacaulis sp.]